MASIGQAQDCAPEGNFRIVGVGGDDQEV